MDLKRLIAILEQVPAQDDPLFAFAVREVAGDLVGPDNPGIWEQLLNLDEAELRRLGAKNPPITRFLALYALLLTHWRGFNFQLYRDLVERYEWEFPEEHFPYLLTFRAQAHSALGEDHDGLESALALSHQAMERLPGCPAVLHLFVSTSIKAEDAGMGLSEAHIAKASEAIRSAIQIDAQLVRRGKKGKRFAQYHATNARWLALRGRHRDARRELHRALDLADPTNISRIAEFLDVRSKIEYSETITPLRREVDDLRHRVTRETESLRDLGATVGDQIRMQAVQLLGVLAAVLAFLFTGTEVARALDFDEAAKLMLIVSGAILVVFGGFALVFNAERLSRGRVVATLAASALGAGLVVSGFLA